MGKSGDAGPVAAVDLGSNSFHMIVARVEDGALRILDRLREPVRLAAGLTPDHRLTPEARTRALDCLERFGQRVRDFPPGSVRAVGTNTLRKANRDGAFLSEASARLGHPIEIISGIEEARLIYEGVIHSLSAPPDTRRLVIDIGGGSTEVVIGDGAGPRDMESLYMGCVGMTQRHFADGRIDKPAWRAAVLDARLELRPHRQRFIEHGWDLAIGASGTVKSVAEICRQQGWSEQGITWAGLRKLRKALLAAGHAEALRLEGLSEERRPVLAGGVAILYALFESLEIGEMTVSPGALREGLLHDLLGRMTHHDVRRASVQQMARRFHVDIPQAERVDEVAQYLLRRVHRDWGLAMDSAALWLHWAAWLHEVGLSVAHSRYHRHGAYLVCNADLPGFSMDEQRVLAFLVRSHRRKFPKDELSQLPRPWRKTALRLSVLLRLAALLRRGRRDAGIPVVGVHASGDRLVLQFPPGWIETHPLTVADLERESRWLEAIDLRLEFGEGSEGEFETASAR